MNDDPRHDKADDAQLLQAWRAGDIQAGAVLYRRHLRKIRNRIRKIVHNEATVEDLVQDVFLSALCDEYLPHNTVAYLRTIARNKAIDELRKLDVIKRATFALEEEGERSTGANADSRLADGGDVERITTGLSPSKRELLEMAGEMLHAEIGNVRGSSEKAATLAIHVAKDQAQALRYPDDAYSDYELLIRVADNAPYDEIAKSLDIPESAVQLRINEARERAKMSNRVLLWMEADKVPHPKIADALGIPENAVELRIDQAQNRAKVKSGQGDGPVDSVGVKNKADK